MANENVTQSVKKLEWVMGLIDEREEQLYAMASSILGYLTPFDAKNIPDDHPLTAWRLAQLLDEMLASTSHRNTIREALMRPS